MAFSIIEVFFIMRASKVALSILERHGVQTIFGYPGSNNLSIYDDLIGSNIRHVLVRHEQGAAHMADGYARATGGLGVCMATSGPGATNLTTGIATAYADSSPLLAITGQVPTDMLGNQAFQEAHTFGLMLPIVKHGFRVLDTNDIPVAMNRGCDIAMTGRFGPVLIDLPRDVQNGEICPEMMRRKIPSPSMATDISGLPDALGAMIASQRPLILAGGGCIWSSASQELVCLAEMLRAPVITTLMGKGAFPEDHPLSLGMIGMHGRRGAMKALEECDLLIVVGSRLADRSAITGEVLSDKVAMIRIDVEPPAEKSEDINNIMLVGDAKSVLGAMIRQLPERQKSAWSERTMQIHDRCACDVVSSDASIDPRWVMHELNRLLPRDTIITTDVGQNQMWAAHFLRSGYPRHFITSGGFGTMGFGFPAAMGVKCAFPKAGRRQHKWRWRVPDGLS